MRAQLRRCCLFVANFCQIQVRDTVLVVGVTETLPVTVLHTVASGILGSDPWVIRQIYLVSNTGSTPNTACVEH